LRGRIEAQSTPGLSTTLTIRLPLTMAVIQGMVVGVGSEQFILPMPGICESLRPGAAEVRRVLGEGELIVIGRICD
ncbi:MAG: chemotaxis protein CheA, partial [bacterium]